MTTVEVIGGLIRLKDNYKAHNLDFMDAYMLNEALERIKTSLIVEYDYDCGMKIYKEGVQWAKDHPEEVHSGQKEK